MQIFRGKAFLVLEDFKGLHNKPAKDSNDSMMEEYTVLGRIGEGAHGVVMKGRHKKTGQIVALKKVLLKRLEEGLPLTALREIKALQVSPKNIM